MHGNFLNQENIKNKTFLNNSDLNKPIHGLNKTHMYMTKIIDYVNNNEGCTLKNIRNIVTNNNLSNLSICRILHLYSFQTPILIKYLILNV